MEVSGTEFRLCKYNPEFDNISLIITDDKFVSIVRELEKSKECNTSLIKEYNEKYYLFIPLKKIKSMNINEKEYTNPTDIKQFFIDVPINIAYEFDIDFYLQKYLFKDKKGYTFRIRNMSGTFSAN